MQSFIVNVPDEKKDFFLELMRQLAFEALNIDEQPATKPEENTNETQENSAFLDWQEEQKILKMVRRGKI
jgi:hypothetical protein